MQLKPDRLILDYAGILSLMGAVALLLSTWMPAYLYFQQAHDPILLISVRTLFWTIAGVLLLMSLLCLFGKPGKMQVAIVAWMAMNLGILWVGLLWSSHGSMRGYFANFPGAFGISAQWAGIGSGVILGCLFLGTCLSLIWVWREERLDRMMDTRRMVCPACGGHIKFAARDAGRQSGCPHCQASIALQPAGTLKMICALCGGRIEFPSYAAGQKLKCPHCKNDITLKERAAV